MFAPVTVSQHCNVPVVVVLRPSPRVMGVTGICLAPELKVNFSKTACLS